MAIFLYIIRAFSLLRCCFSNSYRAKTQARWKKIPTHRVIFEVGTGIIGLMALVAIVAVIIISSRK
jgi:hypothetical protein